MPIQFSCVGCGQPIEVDDANAGKAAQCPYCRRVITVPDASTFNPSDLVAARPQPAAIGTSSGAELPPIPAIPQGAVLSAGDAQREASARRIGNLALAAAALAVCSLLVSMVLLFQSMGSVILSSTSNPTSNPSVEQLQEILAKSPSSGWLVVASAVTPIAALLGLLLGITSMLRWPAANWRAWLATAVCGGLLLCFCGSAILQLVMK